MTDKRIDGHDGDKGPSPHHRRRGHDAGLTSSVSKIGDNPAVAILAYCLSSISMTVVNKYVVSGGSWNLNLFYLAIQATVCVLAIIVCKQLGFIKTLAPFQMDKAKKCFPIALLLVGMIYTGSKALQYLVVPVYTIFKNLTIIVIAYGEVLWFGGRVTPMILLSFGVMVLSSVVAAWADVQAALNGAHPAATAAASSAAVSTLNLGYAWMLMNVACSASFTLGMKKVIKKMNLSDWDTMFYNNTLAIPVLLLGSLLVEDWSPENLSLNFPAETRRSLIVGMVYSGLTAILIGYCSPWCIRVTSSTTYSMVGALNKLPIAVSGFVFFDAPVTLGSVTAIGLGFVSGVGYTWGKIRQTEQARMALPTTNADIVMSASSKSTVDAAR